jgi:hypothetical protein
VVSHDIVQQARAESVSSNADFMHLVEKPAAPSAASSNPSRSGPAPTTQTDLKSLAVKELIRGVLEPFPVSEVGPSAAALFNEIVALKT